MASRSLLAVLVLLLGLHGANAAVCSTTAITSAGNCDCPGGLSATADATFTVTISAAALPVANLVWASGSLDVSKCVNVVPGYEIKTAATSYDVTLSNALTTGITKVGADGYSAEQVGKVTLTAGKLTALTQSLATSCPTGIGHAAAAGTEFKAISACVDLLAKHTLIPSVTAVTTASALVRACAVNEFGCRGVAGLFVASPTKTNTGITTAGSMVLTGTGTITAAVTTSAYLTDSTTTLLPGSCPANSATTLAQTSTATIAACLVNSGYYIASTNLKVPGACPVGSICDGGFPVGTASTDRTGLYGVCTVSTLTASNQKCYCPGGTTATSAGDITSAIKTGDIYGTITWAANTPSPITLCVEIMPGFEITTKKTAQSITPAAALTAGITAIPANSFAPQTTGGTITITSGKITLLPRRLATSCPTGTGNSLTSSATGTAAATFETACVDLLPKFSIKSSVAAGTVLNALVVPCKADQYNCPGSANLFSKKKVDASTGIFNTANNMQITALNTIGSTGTINQGTMLVKDCPAGSSTTSAQTILTAVTGCTVNGGYFIDASDLEVPSVCRIGDYCVGGGAVGTAGGDTSCPYGSSTALASSLNSRISDCAVSSGFYVATGALNTPVPCLAGFICSGGTPLGTAGGSVACPVGSLDASCTGSSPSTSVSVSATPISVATPDVTVTSPDVTVTNTVPSASSASTNAASMVLLALSAAMVAL